MPRLTNGVVVVSVSDKTATALGSDWVPVVIPKAIPKK